MVWIENLSLGITVRHHSASLVMPISDPRDRFFYPHHTHMKDTYSHLQSLSPYPGASVCKKVILIPDTTMKGNRASRIQQYNTACFIIYLSMIQPLNYLFLDI